MKEIASESAGFTPLFSSLEKSGRRSLPHTRSLLKQAFQGQSKLERSKLADWQADHQDQGRNRETAL